MDFDGWSQRGNSGWGYADCLPYFRRCEKRLGGDDTFRGRDGTLQVTAIDWKHPLCAAFIDGCTNIDTPRTPDYNGEIKEDVSDAHSTITASRRRRSAPA